VAAAVAATAPKDKSEQKKQKAAPKQQKPPPEIVKAPVLSQEEELALRKELVRVVKLRKGIYKDKAAHPEFASTVLVTATNSAYKKFFKNWECVAEKHGLDFAVVANDDESVSQIGTDRVIPVVGHKVSEMVGWGNIKLDYVGRNKMMTIVQLITLTGLDVVFTDCDNVFLRDPFAPGASLGDLIRSQQYNYIYQPELHARPKEGYKSPGDGGNTGFFYAQGSKKPQKVAALFQAVVDRVDSHIENGKGGADQPIFWQVFNEMLKKKDGTSLFKCVKLCGKKASCQTEDADTLDYCGLDPFVHPTGWEDIEKWKDTVITYHSNYASNDDKIAKLKRAGAWGFYDMTSKTCTA